MTKFVGVGKSTHSDKLWRRSPNYQFAAKEPLTPIIIPEIIRIAAGMPIVFIRQEGRYFLMAMMSPLPKENLFIGPDGQWLGDYVPTGLQSYPFSLARREGADQFTLCVDENSGLVVDAAEGGRVSSAPTANRPRPSRRSWSFCGSSKVAAQRLIWRLVRSRKRV